MSLKSPTRICLAPRRRVSATPGHSISASVKRAIWARHSLPTFTSSATRKLFAVHRSRGPYITSHTVRCSWLTPVLANCCSGIGQACKATRLMKQKIGCGRKSRTPKRSSVSVVPFVKHNTLNEHALAEPLSEQAPEDDEAAEARGVRLPRPFSRLRPEYPETAARAEAEGTVDVLVGVRADGEVGDVRVARWAGFGLDETTVATVRKMHFFPAMKNGTAIAMRVLLRYNFRKPPR